MRVRVRARVLAATTLVGALVIGGFVSAASGGVETRSTVGHAATQRDAPDARPPDARDTRTAPDHRDPSEPRLRRPAKPSTDPVTPPRPERIGVTEVVNEVFGYTGKREQRFRYPGAEYVKLHFSRLALVPGDKVMVSTPDGSEKYTYRVDPRAERLVGDAPATFDESGGFWAMSVRGDTAVVSLESTGERLTGSGMLADLSSYGFEVDQVAHGTPATERESKAGPGHEESVCGGDDMADAACYKSDYPTEYRHSRPVARLLIGGTSLCTAFRIGPKNRLLTNHHCFSSAAEARSTEVWFGYECRSCNDHSVDTITKVTGADVLSTDRVLDYTLFSVSNFRAVRDYGYLELDSNRPDQGDELYIPQHPDGDRKQISMSSDVDSRGACQVEDPSYTGYAENSDVSYRCDTAAGSSGAPVLSRESDKVIALHHFGGCPNSGVRADLLRRELGNAI